MNRLRENARGTDEQLIASALAVCPIVAADAEQAEQRLNLTDRVVAALRGAGIYGILVPSCLGGKEADLVTALRVVIELTRADGSAGWCFMAQMCWNAAAGSYMGADAVQEIFGNGPDVVIAGQGMPNGTAEIVPGGYRVNGRWSYGSGIKHASLIQFGCVLTKDGVPLRKPHGAPELHLCATHPGNVAIHENWNVLGLRGTGSHDYVVDDLFVPEAYSYRSDAVVPQRGGPIYTLGLKNTTALGHTGFALGVARRALDELVKIVRERRPSAFGMLGDSASFQQEFAMAEMRLRAATALAVDAWGEVQAALDRGEPPGLKEISVVRALTRHAHEVASNVISFAYKMAGGASFRGGPLQRCFRDIHAGTQHVLVSHQIAQAAGKILLGFAEPGMCWGLLGLEPCTGGARE
jgi:alkylation response protein AidB-like acyl-CoA dehydrogenase